MRQRKRRTSVSLGRGLPRVLGTGLTLLGFAFPIHAAGSLRVADLVSLPGAGDLAVADFIDSAGTPSNVLLTLDFDHNQIVSHEVGPGSILIDGVRADACDGPRQLDLLPGRDATTEEIRAVVVCSRGNEVAEFGSAPGGVINFVTRGASGGTDPSDVALTRDGRYALVTNLASDGVTSYGIDPGTGLLSLLGTLPVGDAPGLVDVNSDGIGATGNTGSNDLTIVRIDPATGLLSLVGTVTMLQRPTALEFADEISSVSPMTTMSAAGRTQLLYVGVRSSQPGVQDQIRTYRVGAGGALSLVGNTSAGFSLTDIAVAYDRLFGVTVSAAGRDEIRVYRREGNDLLLDTVLETPESPSFKQIAVAPSRGRVTTLFVTGYQAGWLRSVEYTRDDDPACAGASEVFCANANRFEVSVDWSVPSQGTSGRGIAVPLTSDTGYFWFFSANNVELVIKVVDGRAFNNFFWVFYGALSDVAYTITVTDTVTGRVRRYTNTSGRLASVADVVAFPGSDAAAASVAGFAAASEDLVLAKSREEASLLANLSSLTCSPDPTGLCLNASRFQVRVAWRVPSQGTSGAGMAVPMTTDTGYFWFFSPNNVELVIKVVDGRAFNDFFWVFYGALSDVEYTITVTDTATGAEKTYFNPSGTLASVADVAAF